MVVQVGHGGNLGAPVAAEHSTYKARQIHISCHSQQNPFVTRNCSPASANPQEMNQGPKHG
jgi:hypothetical protein